jgi:hypothetical protein
MYTRLPMGCLSSSILLSIAHNAFHPSSDAPVYMIEAKDFIPFGHVDYLKNTIPTSNTFEEGNVENISPKIKIDISVKPNVME